MPDHFVLVALHISADEYLRVYKGSGKVVRTRDARGQTVQFPARILQRFVTRDGISGTFRISFDAQGKFTGVERA